jgi:hypothetical protein
MTMLALNVAPFIALVTPKIRILRQWISKVIELIAESRMRQVQRELERHGFVARPKK